MDSLLLNVFSCIILSMIIINEHKASRSNYVNTLFFRLVLLNIFLLIIETTTLLINQKPGALYYYMNVWVNFLSFITDILPALGWFHYVCYQIFHVRGQPKNAHFYTLFVFVFNAAITVISLKTGWFYSIDPVTNTYHRGPLFALHTLVSYLVVFSIYLTVLRYRKIIESKRAIRLLVFPLPVIVGNILQTTFYGYSFNWPSMMLSLLILYFDMKDTSLNRDYLTGLFNRRPLDRYLQYKAKTSSLSKSFSAILLDIDNFKKINDRLGHHYGDAALRDTASILRGCLVMRDFIARIGGDEFFVVLDVSDYTALCAVAARIDTAAAEFNRQSNRLYTIGFSMGYDVYAYEYGQDTESFIQHIDALMYQQKRAKKERDIVARSNIPD